MDTNDTNSTHTKKVGPWGLPPLPTILPYPTHTRRLHLCITRHPLGGLPAYRVHGSATVVHSYSLVSFFQRSRIAAGFVPFGVHTVDQTKKHPQNPLLRWTEPKTRRDQRKLHSPDPPSRRHSLPRPLCTTVPESLETHCGEQTFEKSTAICHRGNGESQAARYDLRNVPQRLWCGKSYRFF